MAIKKFNEFLSESIKYLNQQELLQWLDQRQDYVFVALDTETTGLRGPRQEQLTQVAAVAFKLDFPSLTFSEISSFNEKIALNPDILSQLDQPGSRIRDVFKFTRYEINQDLYKDEQEVLDSLIEFVDGFDKVILLIQNAPFDIPMINIRKKFGGLNHEIFDTKDFYAYFLLPTLQKLAETDPEAERILSVIGKSSSGKLPTASLPKVAAGMGIPAGDAHDALFDCRYMIKTLESGLTIVKDNPNLEITQYIKPRISMDRYIKMKNKSRK